MKRNYLLAGLLSAGLCLNTACSDDELTNGIDNALQQPTIQLVDASGNPVSMISGKYGEYYLKVVADGKWEVKSQNDFIALPQTKGEGNATIPVLIGCNWGGARVGGISINRQDVTTRAESGTTVTVNQTAEFTLDEVKNQLSSNQGAGYSYQPYSNYCLGTHIQLFNMTKLDSIQQARNITLITDELYPVVEEEVTTADSESDLSKKLSVAASVTLNFSAFSADVKGAFDSSSSSTAKKQYAVKRMKSYQYTREINFMNIVALAEENETVATALFSPGFKMMKENFEAKMDKLDSNTDAEEIEKACKRFVDEVGPCFISKSVMGCVLDYYISMNESELSDSLSITGALNIKVSESITVEGDGGYDENDHEKVKNVEAKINVRGGDVSQVSILSSGGTLSNEVLQTWQQSIEPKKAVMIDMKLVDLSMLIKTNSKAQEYLRAYLEKVGEVKEPEAGN
ncbi:MAC/perforin domain-containing protein [Mediterranea massiliensis]|uniref:MAC/perforin domain-containing protein n=1 Tax=Mediterranea massiliensis TaxID=1841865 RepID=UPI0025A33667|nr:MAC/perforin domain-containing protein [Mediterranea massiliensis]MDM8336074.1 MAC/perforin domain-containing protein [Mediterranea massiliensis]